MAGRLPPTQLARARAVAGALTVSLALAACGGAGKTVTHTVVVTRTPDLGPATGEARAQPLAARTSFAPRRGAARRVTFHSGGGCGTERWAVKTMTDPLAGEVDLSPKDTTIAALVAIRPPVGPTDRVAPTEETTFRVQGVITLVKRESDSDLHVVVEDGAGNTMIVEATSPDCDQGSLVAAQIAAVRQAFEQRFPTESFRGRMAATVTGVGFFDKLHGQTGVAPNGIELHPITAIEFAPGGGPPTPPPPTPPPAPGTPGGPGR
jgi:hypothetical protein